ncbi:hypothetical protein B0H13DRAFT_2336188 [Mycena leptocephala]|nr:hypothetical protein B0H13DRAFT_2336188 [Mycena leptocephala]
MHFPTLNPHGSASGMHKMTTLSKMAWVVVPPVSRGPSYGGGQTEPSELQNNKANTQVKDELLADESFQHLICVANVIFWIFAPILFLYFQTHMALLEEWKPFMVWNAAVAIFAACTFNFGPHALTVPTSTSATSPGAGVSPLLSGASILTSAAT